MDYRDAGGNGAAMRIAPHVLANANHWPQAAEDIWKNAIISHGHPHAILGALIYGHALWFLLREGIDAASALSDHLRSSLGQYKVPDTPEFRHWLREWNRGRASGFETAFDAARKEARTRLDTLEAALSDGQPVRQVLAQLGCFHPSTRGSGLLTVLAGIYIFARQPKMVEQNVLTGVNALGTDTDSIAAFVAGLLSVSLGSAALLPVWNEVQDVAFLRRLGAWLVRAPEAEGFDPRPGHRQHPPGPALRRAEIEEGLRLWHRTLGEGQVVTSIKQPTASQGKTVTLARIRFDVGQTCLFAFRSDRESQTLYHVSRQGRFF